MGSLLFFLFNFFDHLSGNERNDPALIGVTSCERDEYEFSPIWQLYVSGVVSRGACPAGLGEEPGAAWNRGTSETVRLVIRVRGFSRRIPRQQLHHLFTALG